MRRSQIIMGTGVTIDIPGASSEEAFNLAFERLRAIDQRFSTYKKDSEVSCFSRNELNEEDLSAELKAVIAACRQAEQKTDGYFSAWYAGAFDPSGYVKGWAIAEAGELIKKAGFATYCISIGGDILAAGNKDWQIGIQSPKDKSKILNKLSISNGAVCTSGNYARGAHIINPKTGKAADELASLSVIGPDIIWADVLATALFAMGRAKAQAFIKTQPAYKLIIVEK